MSVGTCLGEWTCATDLAQGLYFFSSCLLSLREAVGIVPLCRTEWQRREADCQQRRKVPDVGKFSGTAFAVEPIDDFAANVGISDGFRGDSPRRFRGYIRFVRNI